VAGKEPATKALEKPSKLDIYENDDITSIT
jgi:hypothetical protein